MLAVTMGDANGVGPEIALRTAAEGLLPTQSVVYGDRAALERVARALSLEAALDLIRIEDLKLLHRKDIAPGTVDGRVGAAAVEYVARATRDALSGTADAIVTLPINKEASRASRPGFSGHTEFIAELCGNPPVTMMLASKQLIVTHVSTHIALAEAVRRVRTPRIPPEHGRRRPRHAPTLSSASGWPCVCSVRRRPRTDSPR